MEVVNVTPQPLYPRKMNPILVVGSWVDPKASLNECGKQAATGIPTPVRLARRVVICILPAFIVFQVVIKRGTDHIEGRKTQTIRDITFLYSQNAQICDIYKNEVLRQLYDQRKLC
jgi:hypothetical protein